MSLNTLLSQARETWGDTKMTKQEIVLALGVVYGDVCRQARNEHEKGTFDEAELKKELGNLIYSTIRWIDDLGYGIEECIEAAKKAQAAYTADNK